MIEILVGNIASGKSTYCSVKAREGFLIVNDDSIVNAIHGNHYDLYDKNLKPLYKGIENQLVVMGITLGKNIIIDRGLNLIPATRRRFIGLGHSLDTEVHAVIFDFESPEVHALRRNKCDTRGYDYNYWLEVATYMHNKYTPPTEEEGFDQIKYWKFEETNGRS